jgi:hypothetical protein
MAGNYTYPELTPATLTIPVTGDISVADLARQAAFRQVGPQYCQVRRCGCK